MRTIKDRLTKGSAALSLPESVSVCGHEIRRMPLGRYLLAMEAMSEMPEKLLHACFPGLDAVEALERLRAIDDRMLGELFSRAMRVVPQEAVRLLSIATEIDEETLLTDPSIGLDGAAEMAQACMEINGIENFTRAAAKMAAAVRRMKKNARSAGSSG